MTGVNRLRDWGSILRHAAAVVRSYDTGVTCKQAFYRLVADGTLRSTESDFVQWCSKTAAGRRNGTFPEFIDQLHRIHRCNMWRDVPTALKWLRGEYWRDRTEGQRVTLCIALEKAGMVEQFMSWFGEYGIPIVATSGWGGQTYLDDVRRDIQGQHRNAILLYGGDFNPDGVGIERDFIKRTDCWAETRRVVLTPEQIRQYRLPRRQGKAGATRNKGFAEEFGSVFSVDMDALEPAVLGDLFRDAIRAYWDEDAYQLTLRREQRDHARLGRLSATGARSGR